MHSPSSNATHRTVRGKTLGSRSKGSGSKVAFGTLDGVLLPPSFGVSTSERGDMLPTFSSMEQLEFHHEPFGYWLQ